MKGRKTKPKKVQAFNLSLQTLGWIDALADYMGIDNKSQIVRICVDYFYRQVIESDEICYLKTSTVYAESLRKDKLLKKYIEENRRLQQELWENEILLDKCRRQVEQLKAKQQSAKNAKRGRKKKDT